MWLACQLYQQSGKINENWNANKLVERLILQVHLFQGLEFIFKELCKMFWSNAGSGAQISAEKHVQLWLDYFFTY